MAEKTEFEVKVVVLGPITKHPNADALSLVDVEGKTVIIRTGDFQPGDRAIYIPVDAIIPENPVKSLEFVGEGYLLRKEAA